jgi:hypothetical protein
MDKIKKLFANLALLLVAFGTYGFGFVENVSASTATPTLVEGNPTCAVLGYAHGFKPFEGDVGGKEEDPSGTFLLPDGTNSITVTENSAQNGLSSWSSTLPIDAVIVKGSNAANVYEYNPESIGDTNLVTPINPSGGYAGLSHVNFCYDYEVAVSKTAEPYFTRTWDWTLGKSGSVSELTLSKGETYTVDYEVTVNSTYADSDFGVKGDVTVYNPDPTFSANILSISDTLSSGVSPVLECDENLPYTLAPKATLTCSYDTSLADGSNGTNTATVTTATGSKVGGGTATKDYVFGDPTTEIDESADFSDDKYGFLGTLEGSQKDYKYVYSKDLKYDICGLYTYVNTASYITNDTETKGSSSWTVDVNVPCALGCTLTQGYWKTHSVKGPAPYDDAWKLIGASEESTLFFNSDKTWYQVFRTPPAGNPYYTLAHQYMAAKLNVLNGASDSSISSTLSDVNTFFNTYPPTTKWTKAQKTQMTSWAATLAKYNEGYIGPGHCSE